MMMKILESLLPKLFIALVPSNEGIYLYAELRKSGKLKKRFDLQLVATMENLAAKIKSFERECAVSYTALLDTESSQGVLRDCRETGVIDPSSLEKICIDDNSWGYYMTKDDLHSRQRAYKKVGLDFLFSPFALLHTFYDAKMAEDDGLYLLIIEGMIFGTVFRNGQLLFGEQEKLQEESSASDETKGLAAYIEAVQSIVKAFYDAKIDDTMFIENIYIADAVGFDTALEHMLEAALFATVEKNSINLPKELVVLSEKELS
jgi:hypothetical protein